MKKLLWLCLFAPFFSFAQTNAEALKRRSDSLVNVLPTLPADTNTVKVLYQIAEGYAAPDPQTALTYAERCLQMATSQNFPPGIVNGNRMMMHCLGNLKRYEEALKHGQRALELTKELNKPAVALTVRLRMGRINNDMNNLDEVLVLLRPAVQLLKQTRSYTNAAQLAYYLLYAENNKNGYDTAAARYKDITGFLKTEGQAAPAAAIALEFGKDLNNMQHLSAAGYLEEARDIFVVNKNESGLLHATAALATAYFNTGDYEKATASAQEAYAKITLLKTGQEKAQLLWTLSHLATYANDDKAAERYAAQGLEIARAGKNETWQRYFLNNLGGIAFVANNTAGQRGYEEEAAALAIKAGQQEQHLFSLNQSAGHAIRNMHPKHALGYATAALKFSETNKISQTLPYTRLVLAQAHEMSGDTVQALTQYKSALSAFESEENHLLSLTASLHLGRLLQQKGDYLQSLTALETALGASSELDNQTALIRTYTAMAELYWQQANYDKAREYVNKAFYHAVENEDHVKILNMRGMLLALQGDHSGALNAYTDALKQEVEAGLKATVQHNAAYSYLQLKKYGEAFKHLEQALKFQDIKSTYSLAFITMSALYREMPDSLFTVHGIPPMLRLDYELGCLDEALTASHKAESPALTRNVFLAYASIYERIGDYQKAYKAYQNAMALQENINETKWLKFLRNEADFSLVNYNGVPAPGSLTQQHLLAGIRMQEQMINTYLAPDKKLNDSEWLAKLKKRSEEMEGQ